MSGPLTGRDKAPERERRFLETGRAGLIRGLANVSILTLAGLFLAFFLKEPPGSGSPGSVPAGEVPAGEAPAQEWPDPVGKLWAGLVLYNRDHTP